MCQPCCNNTYVKYLEPDHSVNLDYLSKLGNAVLVTHTPNMDHPLTQWLLDQGKQPPVDTSINIDGVIKPFCMCDCHRKDLNVCH